MAKKINTDNVIGAEIEKAENKLKEFQRYLADQNIVTMASDSGIDMAEENQDMLHKEILIQIKMQDAIFSWLPLVKKLREETGKAKEDVRGGIEVGEHFKQQ